MSGFIVGLLEEIVSYVTDVWMLRRHRAVKGRRQNTLEKDATDVAVFDMWAFGVGFVAVACGSAMFFLLKLPLWISVVPVVAGMVYVGYRWLALLRA